MRRLVASVPILLCAFLGPTLTAQAADTPAAKTGTWQPPPPPPDDFDWIQLTTGEWLKGEIKSLQDRELEFYSEKLKDMTFRLKDVAFIRSGGDLSLRLSQGTVELGRVEVDETSVVVRDAVSGQEKLRSNRENIEALAPGAEREIDRWAAKVNLGANARSGNTNNSDVVAKLTVRRRAPSSIMRLDYVGNFGQQDEVENINNHRVTGTADFFLSRSFFLRAPTLEYNRDVFTNIEHRISGGVGAGYYLIKRRGLDWLVTGGPALSSTTYFQVPEGEERTSQTPTLLAGTLFQADLTERLKLEVYYQLTSTSERSGALLHHAYSTFEFEIKKRLKLDFSIYWDRIKSPQPGSDGVIPERDDFRTSLSLGVDL